MIFWFWFLVIIVNYSLSSNYYLHDTSQYRLIVNLIFLVLFQILEIWKGFPYMIGLANFKNLYLQKRYIDDVDYYKDGSDDVDEYWNNMLFFEKMEYFYFDNNSKKLTNNTQFMVEMELYDSDLHDRIISIKKWWKSWIILKWVIQQGILFILILSCL